MPQRARDGREEALENKVVEHEFYAPSVSNVKNVATKGPRETLTLIEAKHG